MNYGLFAQSKYLVEEKLNQIIKDIQGKYESEKINYDGSDKTFSLINVINDLNTYPFLSEHKIIILQNPTFLQSNGSIDEESTRQFTQYMDNPAPFSTLIIYVDSFKIDGRKALTKSIKKKFNVFEPKDLDEMQIKTIIRQDLSRAKIHVEREGMTELESRMITNFDSWPLELDKLQLYNKDSLDLIDIDKLISKPAVDDVFALSNAAVNQDLHQALKIYQNLPQSSSEPIAIIMLLTSQFRLLYQILVLKHQGLNEQAIVSELKVHPFRVKKGLEITRGNSIDQIHRILALLATLEQDIKQGKIDKDLGLTLLLVEVCK